MIRHEQGKMAKPLVRFVVMLDGLQNICAHAGMAQLIEAFRLSADGDKERRIISHPIRCLMIEVFAQRLFHRFFRIIRGWWLVEIERRWVARDLRARGGAHF